jgi:Family of unknown function (DUF5317)
VSSDRVAPTRASTGAPGAEPGGSSVMRFILATILLATVLGFAMGGRLSGLSLLRVRWTPAALVGLALQLAPAPGRVWPFVLLIVSFVLLTAFAVVNVGARVPGFVLILIGVLLNFTVIAVNQGMPVSRSALVASHQEETLPILEHRAGAKHHLAGPGDDLLFLGDVIPLPPLDQVVSAGDVLAYGGVVWLIVTGMRRRRPVASPAASSEPAVAEGPA